MKDAEAVKAAMAQFWGQGPGSNEQLAAIADQIRELEVGQVQMLGAFVPRGTPGTDIGIRCERLRDVIAGVLAEG
ncbi:MAG: hypothetical protein ACYS8L_07935 [Planctomycetota bacterium]|jgi:hypothetical protein